MNVPDGIYDVGIRPEDFRIDSKGFTIAVQNVFHIGRDTMIYFDEGAANIRALVDSDSMVDDLSSLKLSVKSKKIHLFDKVTGSVVLHE